MSPNQAQRRSWNEVVGPKWAAYEAPQEASLQAIGARLLALAAVRPNDTVLEVGCGAGTLLAPLAAATGAPNRVTGIDISSTMLALARSRAPACVTLTEADAQVAPLGGPYDVIVSRFGLMFFADPDAAFTNLHAALAPGGRIAFVCWAALHLNPHWAVPLAIAARHLGPPPPPEASAPGPARLRRPGHATPPARQGRLHRHHHPHRTRSARLPQPRHRRRHRGAHGSGRQLHRRPRSRTRHHRRHPRRNRTLLRASRRLRAFHQRGTRTQPRC